MIIVKQDREAIITLNNTFEIYADTWEDDNYCIKAEKASDNMIYTFLGEYKTEDIAKKVLQQIVQAYRENQKIYEMLDKMYKINEGDYKEKYFKRI